MAKMNEDQLRAITDAEMRQAVGYWSGQLAMQRQKAMWYYLGLAKGDLSPPEVDGRSAVVSPDVRNTIESMMPQLMVKFVGSDAVVEFEATKPGDEERAQQATDYINHLFYTKNHGERIAYTWMKDALLSKNGIVKVWWDTRAEEKREEYKGLTDVELAQLAEDDQVELMESRVYPDPEDGEKRAKAIQEIQQQLSQVPPDSPPAQQMMAQVQQIQTAMTPVLYDVTAIRKLNYGGCVRVENVPPEEFLISRKSRTIAEASFVGHRVARTMSELKSMGYRNLDHVSGDDNATALNMERVERLSYDDELAYLNVDTTTTMDDSQKILWVTECYIRVDFDGDGITELRKVVRAGNQILENEVVDCAPFVSITPVPMPHKFFGLSVADLAMESQRVKTALLRGMLDNMYLAINGRYYAVDGQVNLDDLLTTRPGGVVRVKQPQAAGRLDQGSGDLQGAMGLMEYMQGFQEDSTGWTRYNQGSDGDSLNQTATGVNLVTNRADMRLDLIARNFAEGFRELFRMMLKLVCQYDQKESIVKLRGKWVPVNPRDWITGFDTIVNVGLGTGNKDQQIGHLMAVLQQQQFGLQIGTAHPGNVYEAQTELVKALGYRSAEKFFTPPGQGGFQAPNPEADKVNAQIQGQMQLKQMELQADAQKWQAEMQMRMQDSDRQHQARMAEIQKQYELQASNDQRDATREQLKAEYEDRRAAAEAQLKREIAAMQAEIDKYKADLDSQTKLAIAGQSAAPALDLSPLQASLDALIEQVSAPVEIIRDPTGKAIGVKKGNQTRAIARDEAGRAQGLQ